MRLLLFAVPAVTMLASFAEAQLFENVSPRAAVASEPSFAIPTQLPPAPTVGSDVCATAEVLGSAVGSFGYDLTTATTGTEGQITFTGGDCNYGCAEYGNANVQVPGDVWFTWTAPATGRVRISSCGSLADVKIAVYLGPTCPTGTSCIGCSDDYHGASVGTGYQRDARVFFDAVLGTNYLIQVGRGFSLFAGTGFIDAFTIDVAPIVRPNVYDDGAAEVSFSVGAAGNGNCRMQCFGDPSAVTTVLGTDVSWGWTGQTGLVNGTPCVVAIWDDPTDDANPTDCVLLQQVSTTYQNVGTGIFTSILFSPPVTVNGNYFIGVASQLIVAGTGVDAPLTADSTLCFAQPDTAWYGANTGLAYDVTNIPANSGPAFRLGAAGNCQAQGTATYNGLNHSAWTIRSNVLAGPPPIGTSFCSGDGTATACPCGNVGGPGRGCANSTAGSTGAILSAVGVASISADTVVLKATDVSGPGLFFQGSVQFGGGNGITFGDGLLCAGGTILRLGVVFPVAGVATYPGGLTPNPIHIGGVIGAPGTFHYQCWYRDAFMFCSVATNNLTQGVTIPWGT